MCLNDWHVETQNISPLTLLSKEHYLALTEDGCSQATADLEAFG